MTFKITASSLTKLILKSYYILFIITLFISCQNEENNVTVKVCETTISDTSLYNFISDYIKFKKQKQSDYFIDNIIIVSVFRNQDSTQHFIENSFRFNIYSQDKSFTEQSTEYLQKTSINDVTIYFDFNMGSYLQIHCNQESNSKIITYGCNPDLYVLTIKYGEKNEVKRSKFFYEQQYDSLRIADSISYYKTPLILRKRSVLGN